MLVSSQFEVNNLSDDGTTRTKKQLPPARFSAITLPLHQDDSIRDLE